MTDRQFFPGDHVKVADDLGPTMSHFTSGVEAIVIGSYADQYGGKDHSEFTLQLKGHGQSSWYHDHQLTLIERNRMDLLEVWKQELEDRKKQEMDLDWIFSPEHAVPDWQLPGNSAQALANELGFGSMWGSRGEGFTWMTNYEMMDKLATIFVRTGKRAEWEEFKRDILAQPDHPRNKGRV